MKKVCLFLMILSVLCCAAPAMAAEEEPVTNEKVSCFSLDASQSILGKEELVENADSIIVYETNSDTMMYAWNADERVYPASLVKIMTGLIVAEEANMADAVTVRETVLSQIPSDAATAGLQPDEVISVEDLYYCMMVSSANDAATVLADHLYGSQDAFVKRMNEYAAELGCTGTSFMNVHGLHNEEQYTTVRDMAKILAVALKNEIFRAAFGTEKHTVAPTNKSTVRYLVTGNYLMSMDDVEYYYDTRVTGGRTGVTNEGYRNIAISAEDESMEVICILTGAVDTLAENGYSVEIFGGYTETSDLLDMSFDNYQVAQVIYDGQVLTQMQVAGGECDVVLGPKTNTLAVLPVNAKNADLMYRYPPNTSSLSAPIQKGDLVSTVEVWYKTSCVAQAELYAMNGVALVQQPTTPDQAQQSQGGGNTLWIILGILCGFIVLILVLRLNNQIRYRTAVRRNRRSRRRSR